MQENFPAPPLGTVTIPRPENVLENPGILVHVGGLDAFSPAEFPGTENVARIPGFGVQAPVQIGQNMQDENAGNIFLGYGSPEFLAAPEFPLRLEAPRGSLELHEPSQGGVGFATPKRNPTQTPTVRSCAECAPPLGVGASAEERENFVVESSEP